MSTWDDAADLLIFYMRRVWEEVGLGWEPDNGSEIRNLVDHLESGARDVASQEVRDHGENSPHIYADGSTS